MIGKFSDKWYVDGMGNTKKIFRPGSFETSMKPEEPWFPRRIIYINRLWWPLFSSTLPPIMMEEKHQSVVILQIQPFPPS